MVNYTTNYFMKKYALGDLKKFERRNEYILCPTGDYTEIKNFPSEHKYMFEHFCVFGDKTIFPSGNEVSQIVFGEFCKFGTGCNFGSEGRFGFGGVLEMHAVFKIIIFLPVIAILVNVVILEKITNG